MQIIRAKKDMDEHIRQVEVWTDFCKYLDEKCLLLAPFCEQSECEDKIKKDSTR